MQEKDFVTYEYRTKTVKAEAQTRAMDLYESFGWEVTAITPTAIDGVTLSLKRDRKQRHKHELNKIERQAEGVYSTIESLHRAKTMGPSIVAYIFGIVSALILGGGISLVMLVENSTPALIGGIALGLFGIVLCGVNYPIYRKSVTAKTNKLLPIIDDNEEKLSNLLEKGNELLKADII